MMTSMSTETSPRIQRRTLAKGVAWSVPAIAVSSAIPAFAASGPCVDRTDNMQVLATDFPAGQTGVVGGTPTTSGILSVSASFGNVSGPYPRSLDTGCDYAAGCCVAARRAS